jgi:hypothetical protein
MSTKESGLFLLSGHTGELDMNLFPHLDLSTGQWEIGLAYLSLHYNIPNIQSGVNDKLHLGDGSLLIYRTGESHQPRRLTESHSLNDNISKQSQRLEARTTQSSIKHKRAAATEPAVVNGVQVVFPEGSYQIEDIAKHVTDTCKRSNVDVDFKIHANNNTSRVELYSSMDIDFSKNDSIGHLMGFTKRGVLPAGRWNIGDSPANILKVRMIRVVCSAAHGTIENGKDTHSIYTFTPMVEPGFKITERPEKIIYLPVKNKHMKHIRVRLEDEHGMPINTRGELLVIKLHFRKYR